MTSIGWSPDTKGTDMDNEGFFTELLKIIDNTSQATMQVKGDHFGEQITRADYHVKPTVHPEHTDARVTAVADALEKHMLGRIAFTKRSDYEALAEVAIEALKDFLTRKA